MMKKPFPDSWIMSSKVYGKDKKWRIISPEGKVYRSFNKAWASPEGLKLAADSKGGKEGNNGEQVAAAEEEKEADQAGNWDDDTVVGDKQEVDEEEEE
jgi:hypothetical protein